MKKIRQLLSFNLLILIALCFLLTSCVLKEGTPSEKVVYTSAKSLETAKIFRTTGLEAAKIFWDRKLMDMETKDKIVEVANNLQSAINSAATALKLYQATNGMQGGADLNEKIVLYQAIYGKFTDLVMPYLIKQLE